MFRILSLDGGGIKGVFAAAALARIEEIHGLRIIDHFDLISGTSTGGILAIGISHGVSPKELLSFYRDKGPLIFPSMNYMQKSIAIIHQLFRGPKYSHSTIKAEIVKILGERKFCDALCRLVIPTYDAVANRIYVFKTTHAPGLTNDVEMEATEVALATSAAPTYFPAAIVARNGRYIDGGVWANNPSIVALVEAVAFLNIPMEEIDMLSIGTTSELYDIANNSRASVLKWNVGLINLIMAAQAESCNAQAKLLLQGRYHRIDYTSKRGRFNIDKANKNSISDLTRLGYSEAEKKSNRDIIAKRFLNGKMVEPYRPRD